MHEYFNGQGHTVTSATDRGTQFVEKDTSSVHRWYDGQKGLNKDQQFFFKRLEKMERKEAMEVRLRILQLRSNCFVATVTTANTICKANPDATITAQ